MHVMKRKRYNVYLDQDQIKKLQAISEKSGAPIAVMIRRAIDAYLKRVK